MTDPASFIQRRNILRIFLLVLLLAPAFNNHPVLGHIFTQDTLRQLDTTAQVRQLSTEQAARAYPVRVRGVVTYHSAESRVLYVQDSSGGIQVEWLDKQLSLTPGQEVEVVGVSAPGGFLPIVSRASVKMIRMASLPRVREIPIDQLDEKTSDGNWVRITGIVHNAYKESPHQVLEVHAGKRKIRARVHGLSQAAASRMIDASVEIQGVLGILTDAARKPVGLDLWVPAETDIVDIKLSPFEHPTDLPISRIADLEQIWKADPPKHRIRIQGTVMPGEVENELLIRDGSGRIAAKALFFRPIAHGDSADLVGFADLTSPVPRIIDATFLRIKAEAIESNEEKGLPTLTKVRKIRDLSAEEAKRGYPIRVKGVITYHRPDLSMTFIQDDTSAIFIQSIQESYPVEIGKKYEVTGFSAPGDFSPIIIKPEYRLLGPAKMPEPKNATLDRLSSGEYDCLRVRVQGQVRSARQVGNLWHLEIFSDGKRMLIWAPNPSDPDYILKLQDAGITVDGVCSIKTGSWGNIVGFRVNAPSLDDIRIVQPPGYAPFDAPLSPIGNIFRYNRIKEREHRVQIRGHLLHQQPGKFLYVKDDTGTLSVPIDQSMSLVPGDLVSVSGYPVSGEYSPYLEDALVKRIATGQAVHPRIVVDGRDLNNNSHGDLIRIRAKLIDQWHTSAKSNFILQDIRHPEIVFSAVLEIPAGNRERSSIEGFPRNGSELELTGIYLINENSPEPYGFNLLLRTPEDILILKSPPWWTSRHAYWTFGFLLCLILFASAWGLVLKRRVTHQTRIIQQRLEAEAALERKYRDLFEHSKDIVFSCDSTGKLITINPSGERILGYSIEELGRLDTRKWIPETSLSKIREWIELKLREQEVPPLECELIAKTGNRVLVEISGKIFFERDRIVGAQGIARDITERKQAEEALKQSEEKLRQSQKLESIGRLAGGIAHDFNNILAAILGFAELSLTEIDAEHPIKGNLDQILKAVHRARGLVQQILAFSRKLEQERRPIQLEAVLEEAIKLLRATLPSTIEIRTEIQSECYPILADSTQMHQVILNLATNASHAMQPDGGILSFKLAVVTNIQWIRNSYIPDLPQGKYLRLSIRDSGSGIPFEIQKQIFEPYFTTKSTGQGSGLGLAVVHGIVQSHDGAIQLESVPGQGTCFHIYLPCCEGKSVEAPVAHSAETVPGRGHILLVDDEEAIIRLGQRALEKLGYNVTGEVCSKTALKKFSENPDRFNLVITDQTMPHLTGLALSQRIWEIRPATPIIICTGFSEQITPEKASVMGFKTLLNKPYTTSELSNAIRQSL